MTINDRITLIIKELYKGNKRAFSLSAGISPAVIENIVGKRKSSPSFDIINKIITSIDNINTDWFLTGQGNMFKNENTGGIAVVSEPTPKMTVRRLKTDYFNVNKQQIPLYEIEASAGLKTLFASDNTQVPLDYISVPNAPNCDGALSVRGDSMYPILKAGDIVCYKTILKIENIIWGEMYILDIDNGDDQYLTVKFVQKSLKGDQYVKLVSENKHHSEKDELVSHIRALAIVKLSIRYNTIS